MPYSHFNIWDNELNVFLDNLEKDGIETPNLKKWFYEVGAYLIHKHEVDTLSVYIKNHLETKKCFPTINGVGLAGYMLKILRQVEKEFWLYFIDLDDRETKDIIDNQFLKFIITACENHDAFYEWRAELSTTKMDELVRQAKKFDGDVQNQFVETEIEKALATPDITPEFRADVQCFLVFAREINTQMTPATKKRGIYIEKSDSRGTDPRTSPHLTFGRASPQTSSRNMKDRFKEATPGGSPLSIHRQLYGAGPKTPSSRTGAEDHKDDPIELQRAPGLRSSSS